MHACVTCWKAKHIHRRARTIITFCTYINSYCCDNSINYFPFFFTYSQIESIFQTTEKALPSYYLTASASTVIQSSNSPTVDVYNITILRYKVYSQYDKLRIYAKNQVELPHQYLGSSWSVMLMTDTKSWTQSSI